MIGPLQGLGVISMDQERSGERWKELFISLKDLLPDKAGDTTRNRGRSVGRLTECRRNLEWQYR